MSGRSVNNDGRRGLFVHMKLEYVWTRIMADDGEVVLRASDLAEVDFGEQDGVFVEDRPGQERRSRCQSTCGSRRVPLDVREPTRAPKSSPLGYAETNASGTG